MLNGIYKLKEFLRNLKPAIRRTIKISLDMAVVCFSLLVAYLTRFDWVLTSELRHQFMMVVPVFMVTTIILLMLMNAYSGFYLWWGIKDLKMLVIVQTVVVFLVLMGDVVVRSIHIPRSIFFIYWFTAVCSLSLLRILARSILEIRNIEDRGKRKRLLIVGAGQAAEMLVWQILSDSAIQHEIVGLIDDEPKKFHRSIHGIQVLGGRQLILATVQKFSVDEIIIATPSATSAQMRKIVQECGKTKKPFRTLPGPSELVDGNVSFKSIRPVNIEDILGREQSQMDLPRVKELIQGASVFISGAAGSIGSELCRQILAWEPKKLVAVDKDENAMFYLHLDLKSHGAFIPRVADVKNRIMMEDLFRMHKPNIVFHAAAYKHVPCMELNPPEAILNNVQATMVLSNLAGESGVEKFVQISTDKAVKPSSIMGVSKRLCELYLQHLTKKGHPGFITVRFGSQGSVFTVFERQIREGRPVTVTDSKMSRYFMSIVEACHLILEAAMLGTGGCIFILDMGKPIRILKLAKDMISLSGLEPYKDIPIQITGLRAGEKLHETLWYDFEMKENTRNPKIFMAHSRNSLHQPFESTLHDIVECAGALNIDGMIEKIKILVPEFEPQKVTP
jgi:FlaA1/EpsC-like NDP-sugar epimerase